MDALGIGTRREIVQRVFPELRFGGDPDIERYCELRKAGRLAEALSVYNARLRVRYPDDSARLCLLRFYRERDPRYASYQDSLILELADRLMVRIRRNIDTIVQPLERADLSDALHALKAVESVLARLPRELEQALQLLERYADYGQALKYRSSLTRRALELVREFDAVSRADSPADYDFLARSAALEERKRILEDSAAGTRERALSPGLRNDSYDFVARSAAREGERREKEREKRGEGSHYFDPRHIKFTEADRARVEISPQLTRREDKVLALCAKYWRSLRDSSFEHTVFLYSRKYGTRHYEAFRLIKIGKARGDTDDEILSALSGLLATSYSYSVTGDIYMQVMWRRLKARMEAGLVADRLAVPGPESRVRPPSQPKVPAPAPTPSLPAPRASPGSGTSTQRPGAVAATSKRATGAKTASKGRLEGGSGDGSPGRSRAERTEGRGPDHPGAPLARAVKLHGERLLKPSPAGPEPLPEIVGRQGSISDRIRSLSGKAYDVYKVIFLERVREDIRRTLLSNQTRSHRMFDSAANEAEDHIYAFMTAHYDDPFMDWERSAEREAVEARGFSLPSLDALIKACYEKL